MLRHAAFTNIWLATALVVPQLLLVFIFFYWPTGEALYWAFTLEQPFGGSNQWVGWLNFSTVFKDPRSVGLPPVTAIPKLSESRQ